MTTATVKYVELNNQDAATVAVNIKTQLESLAPAATDKVFVTQKDSTVWFAKVTT